VSQRPRTGKQHRRRQKHRPNQLHVALLIPPSTTDFAVMKEEEI